MPSSLSTEPDYIVLRQLGLVELRRYLPFVVAEVVVDQPPAKAIDQAFPILSAYISGHSAATESAKAGLKLEMNAPVTQFSGAGGQWVQFVLPRGTALAAVPKPLDERVRLRELGPQEMAVIHFSGFWSEASYHEHLSTLKTALRAAGLAWTGEPVHARYNAPFTPWFKRRTEVWLKLAV